MVSHSLAASRKGGRGYMEEQSSGYPRSLVDLCSRNRRMALCRTNTEKCHYGQHISRHDSAVPLDCHCRYTVVDGIVSLRQTTIHISGNLYAPVWIRISTVGSAHDTCRIHVPCQGNSREHSHEKSLQCTVARTAVALRECRYDCVGFCWRDAFFSRVNGLVHLFSIH